MTADDPEARRILAALHRRIAAHVARDQWTRTHCTRTLTASGRGVTHNPACDPWPVSVRYSQQAREAIHPLRTR